MGELHTHKHAPFLQVLPMPQLPPSPKLACVQPSLLWPRSAVQGFLSSQSAMALFPQIPAAAQVAWPQASVRTT